jgi:hypothetical protein
MYKPIVIATGVIIALGVWLLQSLRIRRSPTSSLRPTT